MDLVWHSDYFRSASTSASLLDIGTGLTDYAVLLRYISRWLHFGSIKDFQAEDYLMVFVMVSDLPKVSELLLTYR